jgi:hypothetical protein
MAAVFRAHDEALDRMVALKLVYAGPGIDQVIRERFVREALSIAKVDHPNIIPVYAAGESDDMLFIAMRYVGGGDLRSLVSRDGPFPPARVAAYISPVAWALDAAHERGLVHRDVKPANVLVDDGRGRRPDHVYLSDFGLAMSMLSVGGEGLTQEGQFVGTPDYVSPEQIKGEATDGKADQYSLACVAYTLITGKVPYVRDNPMSVLYAQMDGLPPQVGDQRPDLPRARTATVDAVLARALEKDPRFRFPTCDAFADELREALGAGSRDLSGPDEADAASWRAPADGPATAPYPGPVTGGIRTGRATVRLDQVSSPQGANPYASPGPPEAADAVPAAATAPATGPAGYPVRDRDQSTVAAPPTVWSAPAGAWSAVVSADHGYFESVQAANSTDAEAIHFPAQPQERRITLERTPLTIGRRSRTRNIEPDLDLTGDPGVSRIHAMLAADTTGTWTITDRDSPNGTLLNGAEIRPHEPVPLRDGDYINLGAWTRITITRA